jgi:quercetin dioxygenase-like cupin family protein
MGTQQQSPLSPSPSLSPLSQPQHVAPDAGVMYRARGGLYTFKALAADTGGAYTLSEAYNPPGTGVPPHIQHLEDEAFFILAGSYTFQVVGQTSQYGPGEFVLVPHGTAHSFENAGAEPARMLILQSPGGFHERYFAEAWEWITSREQLAAPEPAPDFGRVMAAAQRNGLEILRPVGPEA